ncbi:ImmA/IrrE family metallo-endopeptidase [Niveispirillum cyanobacteriorum]|nr:ImmA/IrrE family metallo-endopeptidase [Niveispirillum cyanobacteriorum]
MTVIDRYAAQTPVPIYDILQDLGLGPEFRALDSDISGWIERRDDDRYAIVINANHAETRKRFTAAHELAHFIFHRDLLGDGVGDNRAYRAVNTPFANNQILPVHERQANSVAANILMPKEAVYRLQASGITDPKELAARFRVSEEAMRIRLGVPRVAAE